MEHGAGGAPVIDRERPRHLEVVGLLAGREAVEADAVAREVRVLAAPQRRLGLHGPRLRAGDAEGDHEDAEVDGEAAVAAVVAEEEASEGAGEALAGAQPRARSAHE